MPHFECEYISVGGNRNTAASSWSTRSGCLAFGADQNVALWYPLNANGKGIDAILRGHTDKVTAVTFLGGTEKAEEYLLTGAAGGVIKAWKYPRTERVWTMVSSQTAHRGAVNVIATYQASSVFVTGGADSRCRVWKLVKDEILDIATVELKPRFIPLTLALGSFGGPTETKDMFFAVGGTRNSVQVYSLSNIPTSPEVSLQANLIGHEGWVRSLCLKERSNGELLLASGSADKYVRLWKFQKSEPSLTNGHTTTQDYTISGQTLAAKVETISAGDIKYRITFEALLLGHEDWVYSISWNPSPGSMQLLTASADGSLSIWEPDQASSIWVSTSKLGDISIQKGATTATGSAGGFWTGLWSPNGNAVTCLGRTGAWRLWKYNADADYWDQVHAISGHTGSVNGLSWTGACLLSTSSDQTTRLHAPWTRGEEETWHEFARPQIHGYDLNCVTTTGEHQICSGADEKLLRVFDEPEEVAKLLENAHGRSRPKDSSLPAAAAVAVLGLSNKAVDDLDAAAEPTDTPLKPPDHNPEIPRPISLDFSGPPIEDILARHTLWPEHEKLYGHGYEISEATANPSTGYLATACKASSLEHAVVRLYDTKTWREIKPALQAHTLTVTRLAWSNFPDEYLLSVGRDRQWALFQRDGTSKEVPKPFKLVQRNPKAHTRMILDASFSPIGGLTYFATGSRDKTVKIWKLASRDAAPDPESTENPNASPPNFSCALTISHKSAVTAVAYTCSASEDLTALAVGEESGAITVYIFFTYDDGPLEPIETVAVEDRHCPSKAVNRLSWHHRRHMITGSKGKISQYLGVAGADGTVRVLRPNLVELNKESCFNHHHSDQVKEEQGRQQEEETEGEQNEDAK